MALSFNVYLSGEIHTDWREEIQRGAEVAGRRVSCVLWLCGLAVLKPFGALEVIFQRHVVEFKFNV